MQPVSLQLCGSNPVQIVYLVVSRRVRAQTAWGTSKQTGPVTSVAKVFRLYKYHLLHQSTGLLSAHSSRRAQTVAVVSRLMSTHDFVLLLEPSCRGSAQLC